MSSSRKTDTCVRLNIKEVLAAPSRNMEAQTDEIVCRDLGSPKGQIRVSEGVDGHGLPARALQAPASPRGSIKPEVPEVLPWCAADDILLPCCRNTEGPPSWNPSNAIVTSHQQLLWRGWGFAFVHRRLCCEQFSPAASPLQRAKGSMQQESLNNEQWRLRDAQREEPANAIWSYR